MARRRALAALVSLTAAITVLTGAPAGATPETVVVQAKAHQTMTGFGASGAWWTIDVARFPAPVREQLARLLFSPDGGIALSQWRWNIGGGGVGVTVPTGGESELGARNRAPDTFYQAPGRYDWSVDAGGTAMLKLAAKYRVPDVIGFAVSAPPDFTTNHQSCGGTLTPGAERAYAEYLSTVVRHARDSWHANVNHVSPMNEPDYTRGECTQEGMAVPADRRADTLTALRAALPAGTGIIADESSRVDTQFLPETPQWMSDPGAAAATTALAHHTYDFPSDATLNQARDLAHGYGKPLWATEICCSVLAGGKPAWSQGYDPTITGGLALADIVAQDLTQADDSAFQWWVAMSAALGCDPTTGASCTGQANPEGWNDGLVYYDPQYASHHNYRLYPTKRLWALGNFSRFVRPGAVRHEVTGTPDGVHALAFRTGREWTLVVVNNTTADTAFPVRFPGSAHATGAWRTDGTHDLAAVAPPRGDTVPAPGHSITTYRYAASGA